MSSGGGSGSGGGGSANTSHSGGGGGGGGGGGNNNDAPAHVRQVFLQHLGGAGSSWRGGGGGGASAAGGNGEGPAEDVGGYNEGVIEMLLQDLPALRDASSTEATEALFLKKLELCCILCDYTLDAEFELADAAWMLGLHENQQSQVEQAVSLLLEQQGHVLAGSDIVDNETILYYTDALEILKAKHGDADHQFVAATLHRLGLLYLQTDDWRGAMRKFTEAVRMKRSIYGAAQDHVEIAASLHRIGNVHEKMGEYPQAIRHYQSAVTMYSRLQQQQCARNAGEEVAGAGSGGSRFSGDVAGDGDENHGAVIDHIRKRMHYACNAKAKESKLLTLVELTIYIRTDPDVLVPGVCASLCDMVGANLFRDAGTGNRIPNAPEFDADEDDPMLVPEWEHLRLVYELLDKFLDSPAARRPETTKQHINEAFVCQVLKLFYNEDPRERMLLKGVLHKMYGTFVSLRKRIRKTMEHIFIRATYDNEGRCNGISDLLQILGSIINGFALPLKEEHIHFLKKVLLPLHSASCFQQCHEELRYCTIQYVEKDGTLAWPVLKGLLQFWSKVNSTKQVLFLSEVEEVFTIISDAQFRLAQNGVFKQIARCMASQHFQVAEGALSMLNRGRVENLVRKHKDVILPIVIPVLNRCITHKPYWNPTILGIAMCLRQKLKEMSPDLFETTIDTLKRKRSESQSEHGDRESKWRKLAEMAKQNDNDAPTFGDMSFKLKRKDSVAGLESDDEPQSLESSYNGGAPKPLMVRRKSLLPKDMGIQLKIANFAKEKSAATETEMHIDPHDVDDDTASLGNIIFGDVGGGGGTAATNVAADTSAAAAASTSVAGAAGKADPADGALMDKSEDTNVV